jgi:multiple sugar transport system permease protein
MVGSTTVAARPAPATRAKWSPIARHLGSYLFLVPAIAYMAFTMLYPVYANVRMSLHEVDVGTFLSGNQPWAGLANYRTLLDDPAFSKAVRLSLTFTAGSIVFQFTIGFLLALLFNQPFPGNNLLRSLLLLGWLMPTVLSGSIFRWMLDGDYGVLNYALSRLSLISENQYWLIDPKTALLGTIIANIWVGIPFNMLLLLAGLQNIPTTLYEAASIDGAGGRQRFWSITLPLMRPVALSVALLGLIYTFKVFDLVYIMTGGGPVDATTVLPIFTYQKTFQFFQFGLGAASAALLLLALLVVAIGYVALSRREEAAT